MHLRTLEQISNSGMKPIFARWFSFTVLIFISPLDVHSFPDTVFLPIGRGRGNSWSNFSIRAIPILVNQLKSCRNFIYPALTDFFSNGLTSLYPVSENFYSGIFHFQAGRISISNSYWYLSSVARLSVNGNVQPQYVAQRSIAGCTVFTAFAFYSILP